MTSNGNLSYELVVGRIDNVTSHQYDTGKFHINPMFHNDILSTYMIVITKNIFARYYCNILLVGKGAYVYNKFRYLYHKLTQEIKMIFEGAYHGAGWRNTRLNGGGSYVMVRS